MFKSVIVLKCTRVNEKMYMLNKNYLELGRVPWLMPVIQYFVRWKQANHLRPRILRPACPTWGNFISTTVQKLAGRGGARL